MHPYDVAIDWSKGAAAVQTAIDILGWAPNRDSLGFNGQPLPWQFKGFGTNLARYFQEMPYLDWGESIGDIPLPTAEFQDINDFMVDLFSCAVGEVGNPKNFSVFGET